MDVSTNIAVGDRASKRLEFIINHNIFQRLHRKIEKFNPDNLFQYSKVHGCFNINPLLQCISKKSNEKIRHT